MRRFGTTALALVALALAPGEPDARPAAPDAGAAPVSSSPCRGYGAGCQAIDGASLLIRASGG